MGLFHRGNRVPVHTHRAQSQPHQPLQASSYMVKALERSGVQGFLCQATGGQPPTACSALSCERKLRVQWIAAGGEDTRTA
jgi:hypothetical protein